MTAESRGHDQIIFISFCKDKYSELSNVGISFVHLQDCNVIVNGSRVDVKLWVLVDRGGEDEGRGGLAVVMLAQHHPELRPTLYRVIRLNQTELKT